LGDGIQKDRIFIKISHHMNKIDQVKIGWSFGYSAILKKGRTIYNVIASHPKKKGILINAVGKIRPVGLNDPEDFEIIGWNYAGQLAGNDYVPLGQKFRHKAGTVIFEGESYMPYSVWVKGSSSFWNKSEIEPVFDQDAE